VCRYLDKDYNRKIILRWAMTGVFEPSSSRAGPNAGKCLRQAMRAHNAVLADGSVEVLCSVEVGCGQHATRRPV
jgi:hypothetical protein